MPVDQLGVPTYDELVLVARSSTVESTPRRSAASSPPSARGTAYAIAHPPEAANAVLSAGKGLDPMQTRAEVNATLPLLAGAPGPALRLHGSGSVARVRGVDGGARPDLDGPAASEVLTNELLPPG